MANVLDLRRRIRSVRNTRQITKAMKMVSAAKLRRAQERAISARPYAAMLASVLESLKRRAEIYDPETGECRHPAAPHACGEAHPAGRCFRRQGVRGRLQHQHLQSRRQLHRGERRPSKSTSTPSGAKAATCSVAATRPPSFLKSIEEELRPDRQRGSAIEVLGGPTAALDRINYDAIRELTDEIISLLHPRGNRRRLPRLQRIQIGHPAARRRRARAAHPLADRSARSSGPKSRPSKSASALPKLPCRPA